MSLRYPYWHPCLSADFQQAPLILVHLDHYASGHSSKAQLNPARPVTLILAVSQVYLSCTFERGAKYVTAVITLGPTSKGLQV